MNSWLSVWEVGITNGCYFRGRYFEFNIIITPAHCDHNVNKI